MITRPIGNYVVQRIRIIDGNGNRHYRTLFKRKGDSEFLIVDEDLPKSTHKMVIECLFKEDECVFTMFSNTAST